jgi:hypothetical protein
VEPDIAFTGNNDSVPWVVWYEETNSGVGLQNNQMAFAAKGTPNGAADGGFQWTVVGTGASGLLDTTLGGGGFCAQNTTNEKLCSLNKDPTADAENVRVAAGTMAPGTQTVPWVTWDETVGAVNQIFVARLVNGGANFELANNGSPISISSNSSLRPDITFSGHTPYVSWRENTGGAVDKAFVGHFVDATNPTFVLDQSNIPLTPLAQTESREPISSGCTANPFNQDGAACQGSAVGTPFFLSTNGTSPRQLFGDAYQTDAPVTGAASNVGGTSANVAGTVNPAGGPVTVQFQFGTTTGYGQTTAAQRIAPTNSSTAFSATLPGLPDNTTVHYRAVANTDFGQVVGADRTLKTKDVTPPVVKLKVPKQFIQTVLKKKGLKVKVTDNEASTVNLSAAKAKGKKKSKPLFKSAKLTFKTSGTKTAKLKLTKAGRKFLKHRNKAKIKITVKATDKAKNKSKQTKTVTLKRKKG